MIQPGEHRGRYTIVKRLGEGGMGSVYEAVYFDDKSGFEQRVAIKEADPEILNTPEGRALFFREAMLPSSLRHPNIATVLEINAEEGYLVYELVDGASMADVFHTSGHRFSPQLLVFLLSQICRALAYAHNRVLHGNLSPVVHRDLSPQNIMIDYDGNVKVVDWGVAKAITHAEKSKTIKGKISYMSPEQATGGPIDARTDIYSLGVIAYEMATSIRPNDGSDDAETLKILISGSHVPVSEHAPDIPAGLAKIIEKMMAVNPDDRFLRMENILDALVPFTPPYTIYRELAILVRKAHPPETIVLEEGKFVSRLVPNQGRETSQSIASSRSIVNDSGGFLGVQATETFAYQQGRSIPGQSNISLPTNQASISAGTFTPIPLKSHPSTTDDFLFFSKRRRNLTIGLAAIGVSALTALITFILWPQQATGPTPSEALVKPQVPRVAAAEREGTVASSSALETNTQTTVNTPVVHRSENSTQAIVMERPPPPLTSTPTTSSETYQPRNESITHPTTNIEMGSDRKSTLFRKTSAGYSQGKINRRPSHSSKSVSSAKNHPKPSDPAQMAEVYVAVSPSSEQYSIWIDGTKKGNTPMTLKLPKGKTTIAIGLRKPTYTKRVRLNPQIKNEVVFQLNEDRFNLNNF